MTENKFEYVLCVISNFFLVLERMQPFEIKIEFKSFVLQESAAAYSIQSQFRVPFHSTLMKEY